MTYTEMTNHIVKSVLIAGAGNLMEDPRAGIFLMDFAMGDTLQLSGRARILFDDHELPGAERSIEFVTERWVRIEGALPVRAPGPVEFSPFNPRGPYQYSETLVQVGLLFATNSVSCEEHRKLLLAETCLHTIIALSNDGTRQAWGGLSLPKHMRGRSTQMIKAQPCTCQ